MALEEPNPGLDRVHYELRATGIRPDAFTNPLRSGIHYRGYLPHVKREGAVYFVTFRLADSLPREVLLQFAAERAERLRCLEMERLRQTTAPSTKPLKDSEDAIELDYTRKVERCLDRGVGQCWLRQPEIADLVAGALRFFDRQRYRLDAWVIMPNHVHAVFWPMPNYTVSAILKSWKQYTATRANRLLNRTGKAFWQPEPFDHWVRNEAERARCCRYVIWNPAKAGLCRAPEDWRWSSAWRGGVAPQK